MKHSCRLTLTLLAIALSVACVAPRPASIEDLESGQRVTEIQALELLGRRDGDQLPATIRFVLNDSVLTLNLLFRIGVPTTLSRGGYQWKGAAIDLEGIVRDRSVDFLGGQSDYPNLGGVFELLGPDGAAAYKVVVPTSEVRPE